MFSSVCTLWLSEIIIIERMWNLGVEIVPIVIGALGAVYRLAEKT